MARATRKRSAKADAGSDGPQPAASQTDRARPQDGKPIIFISHAHRDYLLADALHDALTTCFERSVDVRVSSKDGSIPYGESWVRWIHTQVEECDLALVLLTPTSVLNPWVLYETGGVDGVMRALKGTEDDVIPISFLNQSSDLPGPFNGRKYVVGSDRDGVRTFLRETLNRFRGKVEEDILDDAREQLRDIAENFVSEARKARDRTPVERSEALIQEWCDRFDQLVEKELLQEALSLRRMIALAFYGEDDSRGKSVAPNLKFLDFRLHRRFGELYYDLGKHDEANYARAAEEYRLAIEVAPRDIYLLHKRSLCLVRAKEFGEAFSVIQRIREIDKTIEQESEEVAALIGRYWEDQKEYAKASEALRRYKHRKQSFYIPNKLAICGMLANATITDVVLNDFEVCMEIAKKRAKDDFWARGTLAGCLLALDRDAEATVELRRLYGDDKNSDNYSGATQYNDRILEKRPGGPKGFDWRAAAEGLDDNVRDLKTASRRGS